MAQFGITNYHLWGHLFPGYRSLCVPEWLMGRAVHQKRGTKIHERVRPSDIFETTQTHVILRPGDLMNKTKIQALKSTELHTHTNAIAQSVSCV